MNELEMRETSPGHWEPVRQKPKQGDIWDRATDVFIIVCITLNVITFSNVLDGWLR